YLSLRLVVHVYERTPNIQSHHLQRFAFNPDVDDFLGGRGVDHAQSRKSLPRVFAAAHHIQILARRFVADGVGVFGQRNGIDRLVGLAVEDLQRAFATVGHVDTIQVFAIEDRVWFGDAGNLSERL